MREKIILFGGGGHCRSCIDVIEAGKKYRIAGIIDVAEKVNQSVLEYTIIGTDNDLSQLVKRYRHFFITIGQIKNADVRIEKFQLLNSLGVNLPVIISPFAHVSRYSNIGEGTIIMHNVVVNAGAKIGRNCIINTGAIIEHDAVIGDHCHISTAAVVNGGTIIGEGVFFGSQSRSKQYINIGDYASVQSGVTVFADVPERTIFKIKDFVKGPGLKDDTSE
jgi:sugar O-acyltransferase (sialic acid O-acetyltransferase NeuD family)